MPVHTSLIFRGTCFEQRQSNVFGLKEEDFEGFEYDLGDSSMENILQKTCQRMNDTAKFQQKDPKQEEVT